MGTRLPATHRRCGYLNAIEPGGICQPMDTFRHKHLLEGLAHLAKLLPRAYSGTYQFLPCTRREPPNLPMLTGWAGCRFPKTSPGSIARQWRSVAAKANPDTECQARAPQAVFASG